ncbi:MAG: [protein-PII] uridylyltransferase [Desulfuromonadales bacterium GWD2_61_12]|nr:MAG: [protein-PII] uridylyltransferase [Desulfuromonadales bacterium GWD2_61_12]OGR33338.1 MAG: [protein-PII] uridylyltransferase [Desulfuromonadales bacterium GWC2_61_20]
MLTESAHSYEQKRPLLLKASRAFLDHHHQILREAHRNGASGRLTVGRLTSLADTLVRNLYRSVCTDLAPRQTANCTLIAIGGYGRGELNPRSDIDLMFLYEGKEKEGAERISERILYLLWDLGLEVGYSVRTSRDCLEIAEKDITARTALIDSRYLVGEEGLYRDFEKTVLEPVFEKNSKAFIREKLEENRRRLQKYGSSVYLLEPNIKEGEGGLRDLHTGMWVAQVKYKARSLRDLIIKAVLNEREGQAIEEAYDYLWRIRNELHYLSTRKNDQINFENQEKIAAFLGYQDRSDAPAVEQFMQDYYSHATKVEHLASSLISRSVQQDEPTRKILGYLTRRSVEDGFFIFRGELSLARGDLFETEPARMMRAFVLSQRHGVKLSVPLKGAIRENLHRINDRVRRSKIMSEGFLEILRSPHGVTETLRDMHHLQFLNQFLPEFGLVYCKVQHDAYHIYTVDVHSLFAVEEIVKLWRGDYRVKKPLLTQVANDIEKRELLLLAVLLHDVGKGEGKDHCNKGADMMPTLARRLGLGKEDSQRLEFLVRQHLVMAHTSQRRDLHDEKLILQVARTMEMSENLKMLYLLTFADLKAVGPDVWSEWKGGLLQELYEKTHAVLERGDFQREKASEKVRNRKRKVVQLLEEEFGAKEVKDWLKEANTRYLLSHRSAEIAAHLKVVIGRGDQTLVFNVNHHPEAVYSEVVITTLDVPGLFSQIAGVMAANGVNIMGAMIYTMGNGVALDILHVCSAAGEIIMDTARWQKMELDLTAVIEGRIRVEELVRRRQRPSFVSARPRPRFADRVDVDNLVSDEYTVIDVFASDKVGLLYQITRTLKELGLYIGVSKISTKVDQVADTFYVQDIFGQKVVAPDKIEEIRNRLLASLAADL